MPISLAVSINEMPLDAHVSQILLIGMFSNWGPNFQHIEVREKIKIIVDIDISNTAKSISYTEHMK